MPVPEINISDILFVRDLQLIFYISATAEKWWVKRDGDEDDDADLLREVKIASNHVGVTSLGKRE